MPFFPSFGATTHKVASSFLNAALVSDLYSNFHVPRYVSIDDNESAGILFFSRVTQTKVGPEKGKVGQRYGLGPCTVTRYFRLLTVSWE